jgi:hypothetical protein
MRLISNIILIICCCFLGIENLKLNSTPMEDGHLIMALLLFAASIIPINDIMVSMKNNTIK